MYPVNIELRFKFSAHASRIGLCQKYVGLWLGIDWSPKSATILSSHMVSKSMDKFHVKFSLLNDKEILITCRSVKSA